jgi:nitrous oxide reductase accessory protein NosL
MRGFSFILFAILAIFFGGCQKKSDSNLPRKVHWDRDMCQRCKMVLSDRDFAVEIINPKSKKVYYFDDIGCAVLWLKEEKIPWTESAKIWVRDGKTKEWIDARSAKYIDDAVTPMAYGFQAYENNSTLESKKVIDFETLSKRVEEIEKRNNQARRLPN